MSAFYGAGVARRHQFPSLTHEVTPACVHLAWFAGGVVIGFLTPFIFSSVLELHHDLYYLVYFTISLAFLASYVRATRIDLAELFSRAWRWSLALGLASTAFVVANVLSRESTPGPEGLYAAFEVLWRGVAYGTVDALLLTAFPGVVALGVIGGRLVGLRRHLLFAAVMLPLVLVITGAYHFGYEQYREDGVAGPEFGNAVISVPMLATGNPLGSIVAHASMHVAADLHSYETDVFLPPEIEAP